MPDITDRQIKALKPRGAVYESGFGGGFYVRVYPDGRKVARYRYRLAGKTRILTLGDYGRGAGENTLAELLAAYEVKRGKVVANTDPALERDQAREAVAVARSEHEARVTLEAVCKDFKSHYKGRGKRPIAESTRSEYHRRIDRTIIPKWGSLPVEALPVESMITHMRSLPAVEANRLFTTVGVILNWARKNGLATHNPLAGRDKPGGHEAAKSRALDYNPETETVTDSGEIRAFWTATEALDSGLRDALRLILLSGQRPSEVLSMREAHIADQVWRIPAVLTKNKKAVHAVPITGMMRSILNPRIKATDDLLFPGKGGKKPIAHARLSRAIKEMLADKESPIHGLPPFTPHDLRRTAATQLGHIGYTDAEIGLLLNHSNAGITSIYNRADAANRIRPMLEAWHRRLKDILKGKSEKVVRLRE